MKKLLSISLLFLSIFVIAGCQDSSIDVTFEVNGEEYEVRSVDEDGTTGLPIPPLEGYHFLGWYQDEDFSERFYSHTEVEENTTVYARTQVYESSSETPITDMVQMTSEYEGKSFPDDGIGAVELNQCVDGDTTHFTSNGTFVNLRYLFIDTPESTSVIEPWGPASSEYACDVLTAAETIVVEHEPHPENGHPDVHPSIGRVGTFGRQLGTVWYDGRNLNLEMVELGYSYNSGVNNSQFEEYYRWAQNNASANNRKMHGEDDPLFEDDPQEITVSDLVENTEDYFMQFVNIEGYFYREDGDYYICDGEDSFVFYIGSSSNESFIDNRLGYEVSITNLFVTQYQGNYQLVNFNTRNVELLSDDPVEDGCMLD